jgi:hypothetical protein
VSTRKKSIRRVASDEARPAGQQNLHVSRAAFVRSGGRLAHDYAMTAPIPMHSGP